MFFIQVIALRYVDSNAKTLFNKANIDVKIRTKQQYLINKSVVVDFSILVVAIFIIYIIASNITKYV